VLDVIGSGIECEAIEFLDGLAFDAAAATYPGENPPGSRLVLLVERRGSADDLEQVLSAHGAQLDRPRPRDLWLWRDTVHGAVTSLEGGKLSEDVAVPVERLADALERLTAIGAAHGLGTCAWGHAGDGNIHATFLITPDEREAAERAAADVFAMAIELGGTVTGEHGIGWLKRNRLSEQWSAAAVRLHGRVKDAFDPKGLFNPGKKGA
jgi:FAD/FMN-containing dehydrogenase